MNVYQLHRPQKGLAFIINNLHNEQKATRKDVIKLDAMFKRINVHVDSIKINQDKNELIAFANELKAKDLTPYNLCFLLVLSHGQTMAVTPLHVTALLYSLLFWVLFDVFDYIFRTVIVTGINYKIYGVFT